MDIKDIKTGKATITIITALNFFVPGGLGLFLLKNDLFISMDFAKLLFLSIILSAPFLLVSFMLAFLMFEYLITETPNTNPNVEKEKNEDTEANDSTLVLLTNVFSVVIWAVVGADYWISDTETNNMEIVKQIIKDYVWCSIALFLVFIFTLIYRKYLQNLSWLNFKSKAAK